MRNLRTTSILSLFCDHLYGQSHFSLRISFSLKICDFQGNPSYVKERFFTRLSVIQKRTGKILIRRRDHSYLLLSFFKFSTVSFCVFSEQVFSRSSDFAIMRNLRTTSILSLFCDHLYGQSHFSLRISFSLKICDFQGNPSYVKERFFTRLSVIQKRTGKILSVFVWSRRRDSNPRPLGPEPSALPNCATPRFSYAILAQLLYFCNFFLHLL